MINLVAFIITLTLALVCSQAIAISLPDSVSRVEMGLSAVREFSNDGPIPNRHCASVYQELFQDAHSEDEDHKPKKRNRFRDIFLRMRNYAISRLDCQAFVNEEADQCESEDCRAVLSQDGTLCESSDCKALLSNRSELCQNGSCQAFVSHDSTACSGDCAAYLRNDASLCESGDCRAHLERRSLHCRTNVCFAIIQRETFFCFREDTSPH